MYVCPICNREFKDSEQVAKHSLACWRAQNPNHKSKPAPRGVDVNTYKVSEDALTFFKEMEMNCARS